MTELPTGWALTTVAEIAATSLGKMLDAKQATGKNATPYLRNINVRWGRFDLSDVASMDIRPEELDRVLAQPGDVIACEGGEPGRAAVWRGPEPVALQKALHRIRPSEAVSADYLAMLLRYQATSGALAARFTGTTIKHLPQEKLRVVKIPLAPRAEQERIVNAIEEAFSKLGAGEAGLHTVRQRLKRMRDAVLSDAVSGRLVPQDPADTRAGDVLADLGVKPTLADWLPTLPTSWTSARLGALLREPLRNGISAVKGAGETGLPTFTLTAVTAGDFSERNIKYTIADRGRANDVWVQPGDLLVQRSNTPELVGTTRLYKGAPNVAIFPDLLIRVRPVPQMSPEWVELFMMAPRTRAFVRSQARGLAGSMPKISQPVVEALPIAFPPLEEQTRIVAEVERQVSFIEACARAVDAGLARSAALRRSVLKAAFEGRLVPQDPADEPASVLLERSRTKREASEPAPSRRRKADAS